MTDDLLTDVKQRYGAVARSSLSNDHAGVRGVAEAFGYSAEELAAIPSDANMGLSCGNPTATANLRPGEVVVDLGCGGGLDVFLAARKVGPHGRAIGIDMTTDMIDRARASAEKLRAKGDVLPVEFHQSTIDRLPLADASVDCVVSNCVINLAPDKDAVFREIHRVLKPGGRVAVSDIALKQTLPTELAESVAAYAGCIAGAISLDDYESGLRRAGFVDVQVVDTKKDLNAYSQVSGQVGCCSPAMEDTMMDGGLLTVLDGACCEPASESEGIHDGLKELAERYDLNAYAASVQVYALKSR